MRGLDGRVPEERKAWIENKMTPVLENMMAECICNMPDDPSTFMLTWLEALQDKRVELPQELTAQAQDFPQFVEEDAFSICFNIRRDDICSDSLSPDPFFHWHGSFFELEMEQGVPRGDRWREKLKDIAREESLARVNAFLRDFAKPGDRAFWAPGKERRWSAAMKGPDGEKPNNSDNVLVKKAGGTNTWIMCEVAEGASPSTLALERDALRRITYPVLALAEGAPARECECLYENDPSEPAWVLGSTVIRRADSCGFDVGARALSVLPPHCDAVRWVPLGVREEFFHAVARVPTISITGATLPKDTPFGSPLSSEINEEFGQALGRMAASTNLCLMASCSMRAHYAAMSADNDLTAGFVQQPGCDAVHFKGTNCVQLHGDCWRIDHGKTYLLQEMATDFTNHAKEACLMACCTNGASIALCANGGPTVAINVARFLGVCSPHKVFTLSGVHAASGMSGAAASFPLSPQQLEGVFRNMIDMSPAFFSGLVQTDAQEIEALLEQRPLRLLNVSAETGCEEKQFVVRAGAANPTPSPGMVAGDGALVSEYAKAAAAQVAAA